MSLTVRSMNWLPHVFERYRQRWRTYFTPLRFPQQKKTAFKEVEKVSAATIALQTR